ncbi:MAG: hypothetical protein M3O06_05915, partial [Pseudomonadota bacterium]|nr:hypothetical protein [Pseudomonadota bacterium]
DWAAAHWWVPLALLALVIGGLGLAAMRRRRQEQAADFSGLMEDTDVADAREPTSKLKPLPKDDSFVVEESAHHPLADAGEAVGRFGDTSDVEAREAALPSEKSVNLEHGDTLAEADFHMAYGLYDQAADLVRIALERQPDRRDLRLKLLEIYFVGGNKDLFLQTAQALHSTRDRAAAGEWQKIAIMGNQICPDEPIFAASTAGSLVAGSIVDLNLEGGENRVDIDLFGDPAGELSSLDHPLAAGRESRAHGTGADHLDFTLDAPERGADESPTQALVPRDDPTVESELLDFSDAPFSDESALAAGHEPADVPDGKAAPSPSNADQTAEMSIDDLGLELDQLDEAVSPPARPDAPAAPSNTAQDGDSGAFARALEASFLGGDAGAGAAATGVQPPADATAHLLSEPHELSAADDLHPASALPPEVSEAALDRPVAEEDLFSSEVFEASQRNRRLDLDVGDPTSASDSPTSIVSAPTAHWPAVDLSSSEFDPLTMSEVGTKLDLARAYMDMGDPEGARSILAEVVQEGSASQQQEASRLLDSLPG